MKSRMAVCAVVFALGIGLAPPVNAIAQQTGMRGMVLGSGADAMAIGVSGAKLARYQIYLSIDPVGGPQFTIAQHVAWINEIMPVIKQYGMVLIVDFHVPNRTGGKFQIGANARNASELQAARSVFYEDWARLVAGIGGHPAQHLWFELANEQTGADWPSVALTAARRIRTAEAARSYQSHPICYSATGTTTADARTIEKLPIDGPQILTFHWWNWRIQKADFQKADVQNTPPHPFLDYGPHRPNRNSAEIGRMLDVVREAGRRNRCPVYISEAGIDYRHPNAVTFFNDFTTAATARGIHLTWHAYDDSDWFGSKKHLRAVPSAVSHFNFWFTRQIQPIP